MMLQVVVYVERAFMRQTLCCKVAKQLFVCCYPSQGCGYVGSRWVV